MAKQQNKAPKATVIDINEDAFTKPVKLALPSDGLLLFKIDAVYLRSGIFAMSGWSSEPLEFYLDAQGKAVTPALTRKLLRKDVNEALKKEDQESRGFAFACEVGAASAIFLILRIIEHNIFLRIPVDLSRTTSILDASFASSMGEDIHDWLKAKSALERERVGRPLAASLDAAIRLTDPALGSLTVIWGWVVKPANARIAITDRKGSFYKEITPAWMPRADVAESFGDTVGQGQRGAGFLAVVEGLPLSESMAVLSVSANGSQCDIAACKIKDCATYNKFIEKVFSLSIPWTELHDAYSSALFEPLTKINRNRRKALSDYTVVEEGVGKPLPEPQTSIIIPLYGTLKFLNTQIMCFSEDPEFCSSTELIYVVDDLTLLDGLRVEMDEIHQYYHLPVRWVYNSSNLGFSGANNLGARIAAGRQLIFMNSDVFPEKPGWIALIRHILDRHPETGVVGPRLLYPDGSIQHAGMVNLYQDRLKIWTNVHPHSGCAPELDPACGPVSVPAVTGACLAMTRQTYEEAGGWSEDYIVGDFEDSDLCFRVRSLGKNVVYLPDISLVHLERQSFRTLGEDSFRQRMTIFNALTHQNKWRKFLEEPPVQAPQQAAADSPLDDEEEIVIVIPN